MEADNQEGNYHECLVSLLEMLNTARICTSCRAIAPVHGMAEGRCAGCWFQALLPGGTSSETCSICQAPAERPTAPAAATPSTTSAPRSG